VRYAEAEAAFDVGYGQTMGFPVGLEPVNGIETVEQWYDDVHSFVQSVDNRYPSLYILDSLDALSDAAEMEREIDKGSYGASKARKLSEMFRRTVKSLERSNTTLMIVSQIRDKMNVSFGETKTRSGGRALDFYASIILWLAEIEKVKRTVLGADRVVGIWVKALTKKNKCYAAFRQADIAIMFGYGMHDGQTLLDWLKTHKVMEPTAFAEAEKKLAAIMKQGDRQTLRAMEEELAAAVITRWNAIDEQLQPRMRKY